ncbi:MAG: sulfatase family protein [Opitutaceae bacterium]
MSSTRRKFLRTAALGTVATAMGRHLAAADAPAVSPKRVAKRPARPNLLLLWTDQHRGDCVPWAGDNIVKAPNLGQLAGQSFCFERACCAQPVCTPSRGTIMTGLYPHTHGSVQNNIRLDPARRAIAEYFPGDYATGYFGKWHLGDEIRAQHGFKEWRSIEDGPYRDYYTNTEDLKLRSSYHAFLTAHGFPPDEAAEFDGVPVFSRNMSAAMAEPYTKTAYLADEAVTFLRARRDGQPFVLSVNSLEPHPPTYGPLNESHEPSAMPTGPAFARPVGDGASLLHRSAHDRLRERGYKNHPIDTGEDFRRLKANYYGLIHMVDNAYGRILRALEETGQADNTIVVYTSDHGEMCGDHGLMQKGVFYEPAIHIPLFIHVPWLSRQQVRFTDPFNLVDLVPTLLDLLRDGVPDGLDGRSRAGALRDPKTWSSDNIVIEWTDAAQPACHGRCLVTADRWKLNLYHGDQPELYDLNSDPGELRNIAGAHPDRVRRMSDEVRAWQEMYHDNLALQT